MYEIILSKIRDELELRCGDLIGKQLDNNAMHRIHQALRLSVRNLNLQSCYTYDEMLQIVGPNSNLEKFKDCKDIRFRFLVPTCEVDDRDNLLISMDIDPIILSTTKISGIEKISDEGPNASNHSD